MPRAFFLTVFLSSFFAPYIFCKETAKTTENLIKKVNHLEKKISALEEKILLMEKKIKEMAGDEQEIKLTIKSSQLLKGATKEGIKFEINIENLTSQTIDFVFGNINFSDTYGNLLHTEKLYFDQIISPLSYSQIIIMIDSTSPNFEKIKKADGIKIKFMPSKILKRDTKI